MILLPGSSIEQYIRISNINDFLYCPKSLYLHSIYEEYDRSLFQDTPQIVGTQKHASIDKQRYSSSKHILQSLAVSSEKYGLVGKIDILDTNKHELIERKTTISVIHEGYVLQLYAQLVCLLEMNYQVDLLSLYSLKSNKKYPVTFPEDKEIFRLQNVLKEMRELTPDKLRSHHCPHCQNNIYTNLDW